MNAQSGPFPMDSELHEIHVSDNAIQRLWTAFHTPIVQACRDFLVRQLCHRPQFWRGKQVIEQSAHMTAILDDYWTPFIGDCIDSILVVGVVPWVVARGGKKEPVPRVMKRGTYRLAVVHERDEHVRVKAYAKKAMGEDGGSDVFVLDGFGYTPDLRGNLRSPLAVIFRLLAFETRMMDCTVLAESIRCNPVTVTQQRRGEKTHEDPEFLLCADASLHEAQEDDRYERNKRNAENAALQTELYRTAIGGDIAAPLPTFFPVDDGREIVQQTLPAVRGDFVSIIKMVQEQVCAVLSVPRGLLITDNAVKTDTENLRFHFQRTKGWWAQQLQRGLTTVYYAIYGKRDAKELVKNPDLEQVGELFNQTAVRVDIPQAIQASPDFLWMCYERGVVSWTEFVTNTRGMIGLPTERFPHETDPKRARTDPKPDPKPDPKTDMDTHPTRK